MNEEELDNIQELIERKITLAEVTGGLTSSDKKFIALWNYTMNLQDKINKAIEWVYIVQQNENNKHLAPIISIDELDELLEVLKGDSND